MHHTVAAYEHLFQTAHSFTRSETERLGQLVGDDLQGRWPDLAEEIAGIATGAGVPEDLLFAVNARTEILAGATRPECSVLGLLPDRSASGSVILAQNWDWHPDLKPSRVLWRIVEPSGHWLLTLTEAGILAKIGLNSRGVGVCLNILNSTLDGGVDGVPIHILLRLVLQRCGDVREATELLTSAPASASSCLTVGSTDPEPGGIAAFELSPAGTQPLHSRKSGWLAHTNHFLGGLADGDDRYRQQWPDTLERLRELEGRLDAHDDRLEFEDIQHLLRSHDCEPIAICCHDPDNPRYLDRQETLASVILDLTERRILITDGAPCTTRYVETAGSTPVPARR